MKTVLKSIFLLIISFSCFSQNSGKENLNLVFIDNCSNKIIKPKFEILTMKELNYDHITVYKEYGNWIAQYSTFIKTKNDTIRIPKILFAVDNKLHSKRWFSFNCEKICDGKETDFYANGNKRTEGIYENGKPIEIKEFWRNGKLRTEYFYENLTFNNKLVNYYDENGDLFEYKVYKNKKRKTTIKTFDRNEKLINTEIEKNITRN